MSFNPIEDLRKESKGFKSDISIQKVIINNKEDIILEKVLSTDDIYSFYNKVKIKRMGKIEDKIIESLEDNTYFEKFNINLDESSSVFSIGKSDIISNEYLDIIIDNPQVDLCNILMQVKDKCGVHVCYINYRNSVYELYITTNNIGNSNKDNIEIDYNSIKTKAILSIKEIEDEYNRLTT